MHYAPDLRFISRARRALCVAAKYVQYQEHGAGESKGPILILWPLKFVFPCTGPAESVFIKSRTVDTPATSGMFSLPD